MAAGMRADEEGGIEGHRGLPGCQAESRADGGDGFFAAEDRRSVGLVELVTREMGGIRWLCLALDQSIDLALREDEHLRRYVAVRVFA